MKVLVTGANGFVGSHACRILGEAGFELRAAVRRAQLPPAGAAEVVEVGDIGPRTNWAAALVGIDAVLHLAARVHVMRDSAANLPEYLSVNLEGSTALAEAALRAGVRRFVFLSSVKVNGERTGARPFRADDVAQPHDAYAISKQRAEQGLLDLVGSGLDPVILRPPLVYGPGVRANFLRLMGWVRKGIPLPLGGITNYRSMISVWNLSDLLRRALECRQPAARTFMASDGEDLSTPDLVRRLARGMGVRPRLLHIPQGVLKICGSLAGRGMEVSRLCDSLRVDDSQTREILSWSAPLSVDEGLRRTAQWYLEAQVQGGEP